MSIFEILRGLVTARLICLYRVHILSLCAMRDIQLRRFRTPQIADRVHSTSPLPSSGCSFSRFASSTVAEISLVSRVVLLSLVLLFFGDVHLSISRPIFFFALLLKRFSVRSALSTLPLLYRFRSSFLPSASFTPSSLSSGKPTLR